MTPSAPGGVVARATPLTHGGNPALTRGPHAAPVSTQTLDRLPLTEETTAVLDGAAPGSRADAGSLVDLPAVPVTVRGARRSDLPGLARLLVGSSPTTRLGWYGRGGGVLPLAQQEAWLSRPGTLVVETAPGRLLAVAALRAATCSGQDDPIASTAEMLVHDRWQRRGIATTLLRHLAGVSLAAGRAEIQACPDGDAVAGAGLLTALAEHVGSRARPQNHPHGRCVRVHLPARSTPLLAITEGLPAGLRPHPSAGTGAVWAMAVPTVARP